MDYTLLNWSSPAQQDEPSAAGVMQRYAPSRERATRPSGVDASMEVPQDDRLHDMAVRDDGTGDIARFILRDVPATRMRMMRAMRDGDLATVADENDRLTRFVSDHDGDLAPWETVAEAGPEARATAQLVRSLRDGSFRDSWAIDTPNGPFSVQMALEDNGDTAVARRAEKLGIDDSVSRALTDRNDPLHKIYGMYGDALSGAGPARAARGGDSSSQRVLVANLKSAIPVVNEFRDQFGSDQDLGNYVAEFDRIFNGGQTVTGSGFMRSVTRGFLKSGQGDATGYLSAVAALRDAVASGMALPTDGPLMQRARMHEANSLIEAFVEESVEAGSPVPLGTHYAAALSDAARRVSVMSSVYGIDLRGGESGLSRRIAQTALKNAGVAGVDDGGLQDFLDTVGGALDQYSGSDGQPRIAETRNGQRYVQPAPGPYGAVESALKTAVGRTLYGLHTQAGGTLRGAGELLAKLRTNLDWQTQVKGSVRNVLRARIADDEVADAIAEKIYLNPLNGSSMTVARAFDDLMELRRPDGTPKISDSDLIRPPEQAGAPVDRRVLAAIVNRPTEVLKTGGDTSLQTAAVNYAKAALQEPSRSHNDHAMKALGDLVAASQPGVSKDVKEWTKLALRVAGAENGWEKALSLRSPAGGSALEGLTQGLRKRDPDAMMAAALISSVVPLDYTTGLGPELRVPHSITGTTATLRPASRDPMQVFFAAVKGFGLDPKLTGKSAIDLVSSALGDKAAGTLLVKSGVLDLATGKVDAAGFLSALQHERSVSPSVMANSSNDQTASRLAIKARKAATTLMPETTVVGRFTSLFQAKLQAEGYTPEEINLRLGRASALVGAAYRTGGDAGAYYAAQAADRLLSYSVRYKPTVAKGADGRQVLRPDRPSPTSPMTDEAYQDEKKHDLDILQELFPQSRRDDLTAAYDRAEVDGRANWLETQAIQQKAALAGAQKRAQRDAERDTPSSE